MAQRPDRTPLTGSTLVRLLAGLIDPQQRVRDSRMSFADALNQWTGWTESLALSQALERPLPAGPAAPSADRAARADRHAAESAECRRVRALLAQSIAREVSDAGRGPLDEGMGFTPFRQCHQARQQAMEVSIGPLRERVRAALAEHQGEMARLAALDAVMAEVLAAQERRLLATVPALLARHFERLCGSGAEAEACGDAQSLDADARRELFRLDQQAVLLAELELRLQPVLGLLAALQPPSSPEGGP